MTRAVLLLASAALALAVRPAWAQPANTEATASTGYHTLRMGTTIPLITDQPLSSKRNAKGDMVRLKTAADVLVDGHVVIPKGTTAMGQVSDARAKGAMGMTGQLSIRPLYIRVGDSFVRLGGAAANKGTVTAGAVAGLAVLSAGFTGRSAEIPQGTALDGFVEHAIALPETAAGPSTP